MKEYAVNCDITFSGTFYVEAMSEEDAENKVKTRSVVPSDIRNFYHFDTQILDVECESTDEE